MGWKCKREKINMNVSDFISIITPCFAVVGGIFALIQWYKRNKINRAEFFNQIAEKLYFNKDIGEAMYYILYNDNWYTKDFHENDIEKKVDALLLYLTYICYLHENKIIRKNEFEVFKYELNSICCTSGTKTYLWHHYHYSLEKYKSYSFYCLIKYLNDNILNEEKRRKFYNDIPNEAFFPFD
jgi:hypothetical protein